MATVSIYLNFDGKTEEAFQFYKSVFRTEFVGKVQYMREAPVQEGMPELSEEEKNRVLHVALPILGGVVIMGTDILRSMGHTLVPGKNMHINLEPDTRAEADRLFKELSEGGSVGMPLTDMFWGGYFGSFTDKFGTNWMINCAAKE